MQTELRQFDSPIMQTIDEKLCAGFVVFHEFHYAIQSRVKCIEIDGNPAGRRRNPRPKIQFSADFRGTIRVKASCDLKNG